MIKITNAEKGEGGSKGNNKPANEEEEVEHQNQGTPTIVIFIKIRGRLILIIIMTNLMAFCCKA